MSNRGAGVVQVGPVRFRLERVLSAGEAEAVAAAVLEQRLSPGPPFNSLVGIADELVPYSDHLRLTIAQLTATDQAQQEHWEPHEVRGAQAVARPQWLHPGDSRHAEAGQRLHVAVLYLQRGRGDATAFPGLGVRLTPEAGTLVLWNLLDVNGRPIREAAPLALEPSRASCWELVTRVRERPFRPQSEVPTREIPIPKPRDKA